MVRGAVREAVGDAAAFARARTILLIGEVNPLTEANQFALYPDPPNCAGWRLCRQIFQCPEDQYLAMWRANLCGGWWNKDYARRRALELIKGPPRIVELLPTPPPEPIVAPWSVVVMLGRKVSDAVLRAQSRYVRFDPFEVKSASDTLTFVCLPHPSGRCREWNDPRAAEKARVIMRAIAPEMRFG